MVENLAFTDFEGRFLVGRNAYRPKLVTPEERDEESYHLLSMAEKLETERGEGLASYVKTSKSCLFLKRSAFSIAEKVTRRGFKDSKKQRIVCEEPYSCHSRISSLDNEESPPTD